MKANARGIRGAATLAAVLSAAGLLALVTCGCRTPGHGGEDGPRQKSTLLSHVPPADPTKYESVLDAKEWRNPYLLVRPDGVAFWKLGGKVMSADELAEALVALPPEAWPYGRVVAVQASGIGSDDDLEQVRRNMDEVVKILRSLGVTVSRWPSS